MKKNEITQKMALKIFYVEFSSVENCKIEFLWYILLMMNNDDYICIFMKKSSKRIINVSGKIEKENSHNMRKF